MPRKNRLTGAEIRSIRSPRRAHGGLFSVTISPSIGGDVKCACVVSKKVAMKAVTRNLIKRRCRAALAGVVPKLPAGSYVVYAKKDAAKASYKEISADIEKLLKSLRSA